VGACGILVALAAVGCYKQKLISSRRLVRVAVEAVLSEAEATWRYDDGSQSLTVLSFPAEPTHFVYVSIRLHTSAYVCIRMLTVMSFPTCSRANTLRKCQHTSAYVCIRMLTVLSFPAEPKHFAYFSIRQNTSAYVC
jgi:hypothetical protein